MSRRRFYAPPESIEDSTIRLSKEESHHLIHVVRLHPGDRASVFDGCGREYSVAFRSSSNDRAQLEILGELDGEADSELNLTLAQSLAKGEKFDFIVQKATELGVRSIVPVISDHADVRIAEQQTDKRLIRWRRISLEASKQCGRRRLVEISSPETVEALIDRLAAVQAGAASSALVFSERGGETVDVVAGRGAMTAVTAFIGPEGGWSEREFALFNRAGATVLTLGPRLLRTETAAIAAITLIQHFLGDLSAGSATVGEA